MKKFNKMYLVLGDWSDDGHGKTDKELYEVNKTVEEVQEAYKASCRLTGFSFNHNEDFTGIKREWKTSDLYHICTNYEDYLLKEPAYQMFKEHGFDFSDWDIEDTNDIYIEDSFEDLWWFFVGLSLPDLEYKKVQDDIPVINGYWNDNLNVQFGYGLYD